MNMKFEVTGCLDMGWEETDFSREIEAESEDMAREKILSLLGSEHRAKRHEIDVQEITAL